MGDYTSAAVVLRRPHWESMIGMERGYPSKGKRSGVKIQYLSKRYVVSVPSSVPEHSHCHTCFEPSGGLMLL